MDNMFPNISTYDFDYSADINRKMRVPQKIILDSDNSVALSEAPDASFCNYPAADLNIKRSSELTPGYSPDVLNNSDVHSKLVCNAKAQASSNSTGSSAKATASAGVSLEKTSSHRTEEPLSVSKCPPTCSKEHGSIENRLVKLERRISHLEFQQAVMKSGLTMYILYRIIRWIMKSSQ
ncbi:unnamed protein product [Schistosoma turkestanicum]|nr:unnamed protein product [Schistosoma turkestanicum]